MQNPPRHIVAMVASVLMGVVIILTGCESATPGEQVAASASAPSALVPSSSAQSVASATAAPAEAGPAPTPVPCDGPEFTELAKQLNTAGGVGVDLGSDKGRASIDEAIASINGKRVAFTSCAFKRQGNDEVTFAARKDAPNEITCRMAGGEEGNRKFRDAAMGFDPEKLRLDVSGKVASNDNPNVTRYLLTECTITPHE
jgi:hypothetical protein